MGVAEYEYLIIGGAPKAGTSSLYKYLADHPGICPSSLKETRFFLDHDDVLPSVERFNGKNIEQYETFFKDCKKTGEIRMEATPDYLYSQQALRIGELLPHSKMIFVVRDQIERLVSWYKFAKQRGLLGNEVSFDDYVNMQMNLVVTPLTPVFLRALEQGRHDNYLAQFEKYMQNRILVIDFEELRDKPLQAMKKICIFSGLDWKFYINYLFSVENKSVSVRYQPIERFYLAARTTIAFYVHGSSILKTCLRIPNRLIKKMLAVNKKPSQKVNVDPKTYRILADYYKITTR